MTIDEAKLKIKQEMNIVDYIQSHGVQLKRSSGNSHKGLCPFHNEKTPSFTVSEDYQNYKCFGCSAYGDIVSFAMHTHSLDYIDAIKYLAAERGITIDDNGQKESSVDLRSLYKLLEDAQKFYHYEYMNLPETHLAKIEVQKRGLKVDSELYGYSPEAPNKLYTFLKGKGYSDKVIADSELVIFNEGRDPWDFFHGRLMITLDDFMGRPVSFTSRRIFDSDRMQAKYINGKDSPIFHKKSTLYGLSRAKQSAREKKQIIIAEGQFDVEALVSVGIDNVCAASGTAFTSEHANVLRRLVGEDGDILFLFDGDTAGKAAAVSVFKNEPTLHMQSFVSLLEHGSDPCDYVVNDRVDDLIKIINDKKPLHQFVVNLAFDEMNKKGEFEKTKFLMTACELAKYSTSKYITENMLSRISILSATSIGKVNEIFADTSSVRRPMKRETEESTQMLSPKITIDVTSNSDKMMLSAIKMLSLHPDIIIPNAPQAFPSKFKPFIRELYINYKQYLDAENTWRFIPDEYDDKDFVLFVQSLNTEIYDKTKPEAILKHYLYLYEMAMKFHIQELENIKRAQAMSSIMDSDSAKEVAEALTLYEEHNE